MSTATNHGSCYMGCQYHLYERNGSYGAEMVQFYHIPADEIEIYDNRLNHPDQKTITKATRICSKHFLNNKRSTDKLNPSHYPTENLNKPAEKWKSPVEEQLKEFREKIPNFKKELRNVLLATPEECEKLLQEAAQRSEKFSNAFREMECEKKVHSSPYTYSNYVYGIGIHNVLKFLIENEKYLTRQDRLLVVACFFKYIGQGQGLRKFDHFKTALSLIQEPDEFLAAFQNKELNNRNQAFFEAWFNNDGLVTIELEDAISKEESLLKKAYFIDLLTKKRVINGNSIPSKLNQKLQNWSREQYFGVVINMLARVEKILVVKGHRSRAFKIDDVISSQEMLDKLNYIKLKLAAIYDPGPSYRQKIDITFDTEIGTIVEKQELDHLDVAATLSFDKDNPEIEVIGWHSDDNGLEVEILEEDSNDIEMMENLAGSAGIAISIKCEKPEIAFIDIIEQAFDAKANNEMTTNEILEFVTDNYLYYRGQVQSKLKEKIGGFLRHYKQFDKRSGKDEKGKKLKNVWIRSTSGDQPGKKTKKPVAKQCPHCEKVVVNLTRHNNNVHKFEKVTCDKCGILLHPTSVYTHMKRCNANK